MHNIFTRTAAVAAAVAIGTGALALSAPTADAASAGTVTVKEGKRVIRAADRQRCLTLSETRKIVHGSGVLVGKDSDGRYQTWDGRGKADFLDVVYGKNGCAVGMWFVYTNNRQLAWYEGSAPYWSDSTD